MRTVPCRPEPARPRTGGDADRAENVCRCGRGRSCRTRILLRCVAFGSEQNSCNDRIGRGFQNPSRIEFRWWLIERILVHAAPWRRIFDSRAENSARFRRCRSKVGAVHQTAQAIEVSRPTCNIAGMRTFGGFRSGDRFFYGEARGENVHVLAGPYWTHIEPTGEVLPLAKVRIDLPVAPSKLIAVGLNYSDHIAEMKRTPLGTPLIWFKAPSSLLPHGGTIEIAFPEHRTDFEVELGIVISAPAKNVSPKEAPNHVFGYTMGLDISDRDLQKHEKQFGRCKSFDTYPPIGPFVHVDVDVSDLSIELRQNGELRQQARTSQMIYSVAQIVSFASHWMTLAAGDVILTGTPSGVGPIHASDQLEATIDDWPPLRNAVTNARR